VNLTPVPEGFLIGLGKLVSKFDADRGHYLSKAYPEAQAKIDFITPFFKALGWDVENEAGLPHDQREVIVERGETEGRPDYNFRLAGQTKFFVEAKAPSEPLDSAKHILQAKGYAWNTKQVFFVILTDFEEFRFYDASIKPDERKPDEGLLLPLKYTDYLANAKKLWEFSKERVAAGSLDAMLPRDRRTQRLRIPVDEAFLDEMTGWREDLARNVFKNNPDLTAKQLNEVVQRLLDRIVFIRIAEDRRIIEKNQLREAVEEWEARGGKFHLFDWLNDLFHRINEDFNGEIFKPHLSETIKIDSDVLARIIERLYPPKSPYRFDVIGVELLGSIYERYLGKTIRPTAKTVRVEEKPEVRKAGGVYYTPKYIVDYIVKNTVGKVIEGKTPKQIEKLRILDPACGSGSFLIGAFQYLIDYHVRYLTAHPKEAHIHPLFPDLIRDGNPSADGPRLSVRLKARILRHNLYGVDIDPQAVEITMMSLYLKALEGEKSQLPPKQSLLPELKYNIICGNSLIGPDIYDQGTLFADEERDRINAFDWYADHGVRELAPAFEGGGKPPHSKPAIIDRRYSAGPVTIPQVMRAGGFDCVIGNPPYVRIQHMKEWAPVEVEYYKEHYKSASSGNYDIYVVFVEKGLSVLNQAGKLGFILPHKFFNAKYGEQLRSLVAAGKHISKIVHFGDQQVFEGASNYTCLLFLDKSGSRRLQFEKVDDLDAWRNTGKATGGLIPATNLTPAEWNFAVGKNAALFEKLRDIPLKLDDVATRIFQGIKTGADKIYIVEELERRRNRVRVYCREKDGEFWLEPDVLHPLVKGGDSKRYYLGRTNRLILFPYLRQKNGGTELIPQALFESRYPRTWGYLVENKKYLENREHGVLSGPRWYAYTRGQALEVMPLPKIFTPDIALRASFSVDETGESFFTGGVAGGYGILVRPEYSPKYVLGLLNSKLLDWYLHAVATQMRGGYYSYESRFICHLPMRAINFTDRADKARHDRMVALVERMLELNKKKHSGKLAPSELERVEREIAATDAEIDELVYALYGITEEEREIIEGG
jgi:type I restriction-modification system DNA methylase subunit